MNAFSTGFARCLFYVVLVFSLVFVGFMPFYVSDYFGAVLISDGSNAVDMLGQFADPTLVDPVPLYTKSGYNDTPNKIGFASPYDVSLDLIKNRMFISDSGFSRVTVFNLNGSNNLVDFVPDFVLGQIDFVSDSNTGSTNGVDAPAGILYDSVNDLLYVASSADHRVMVYDVDTISNGENAVSVLGQPNYTTYSSATTQSGMNNPFDLALDSTNNLLFLSDGSNNRVLVFNVLTILDGEVAVAVLGQDDYISSVDTCDAGGLDSPGGLAFDDANDLLYVVDSGHHRVLVFNTTDIDNGEDAVNVLGQSDYVSCASAVTQSSLSYPIGIELDTTNSRLYVGDRSNNRVMVFDVLAIVNGEVAVNVLGQPNYTTSSSGVSVSQFYQPHGMGLDGGNNLLYVGDVSNERVMIFDVLSISNGENAVNGVGQYEDDLTSLTVDYTKGNRGNGPNTLTLDSPFSVLVEGGLNRLYVADRDSDRVLVYNLNADHTLADHIADYVLGAGSFSTFSSNPAINRLGSASGLAYDTVNNRLFVSDDSKDRILVFDTTDISSGENAINILGQTSYTASSGGLSQSQLEVPYGLSYDSVDGHLYVADTNNNRVMVFDVSSITDGENAIGVLGQADFTSSATALTQSGLDSPYDVAVDGAQNRLFVADYDHNRVVIYDVTLIENGENAVSVLGQAGFTSNTGATTQSGLFQPRGVEYDSVNNRLFVSSRASNRVTIFNVGSITDGENAINVVGQPNFTTSTANTTQSGLDRVFDISYDNTSETLFVADERNNRVMVFDSGSPNFTPNLPSSLGMTAYVNGSSGADTTPPLQMIVTDPNTADTVQYRIQLSLNADYSSPVIDFTSALSAQVFTALSFKVGQLSAGGTYTVGSAGQSLGAGSYYWRVKTIDVNAVESAYVNANGGAIAFVVALTGSTRGSSLSGQVIRGVSSGTSQNVGVLESRVDESIAIQTQLIDSDTEIVDDLDTELEIDSIGLSSSVEKENVASSSGGFAHRSTELASSDTDFFDNSGLSDIDDDVHPIRDSNCVSESLAEFSIRFEKQWYYSAVVNLLSLEHRFASDCDVLQFVFQPDEFVNLDRIVRLILLLSGIAPSDDVRLMFQQAIDVRFLTLDLREYLKYADKPVTRLRALILLLRSVGFDPSDYVIRNDFRDTTRTWYSSSLTYAVDNGLVSGYSTGTFRPEKLINWAEFAALLERVMLLHQLN